MTIAPTRRPVDDLVWKALRCRLGKQGQTLFEGHALRVSLGDDYNTRLMFALEQESFWREQDERGMSSGCEAGEGFPGDRQKMLPQGTM